MEHIVIRDPSYVAGTREKPEVRIFVQTNTARPPLNESSLAKGDVVWMKWTDGGPIVAKSHISRTISGQFTGSTIEKIREPCRETSLYELDKYWETVRQKGSSYFTVIRLVDEEWLEPPLVTAAKSYGSSWITLDTAAKRRAWLETAEPEEDFARDGGVVSASLRKFGKRKPLSRSMRFAVLRRDSFTCRYCGRKAPFVELEVDHISPYSTVREHALENLGASCLDCNRGKGAKPL